MERRGKFPSKTIMRIVSYRMGGKLIQTKLTDEQAEIVSAAWKRGLAGAKETIAIAGNEIPTTAIKSIEVALESSSPNRQKVEAMRRAMIDAAKVCKMCKGRGWHDVYVRPDGSISTKWEIGVEARAELCQCQASVKERFGVDRYDFGFQNA